MSIKFTSSKMISYLTFGVLFGLLVGGGSGFLFGNQYGQNQVEPTIIETPVDTPVVEEHEVIISRVVERDMVAYQFGYVPSTLEVELNTQLILHINSTFEEDDTYDEHTFTIKEFGVRKVLYANEITTVTFIANKTGTFIYECDVYCGTDHNSMRGQLVVTGPSNVEEEEEVIVPKTELLNGAQPGDWDVRDLFLVIEREARSIAFIDSGSMKLVGRVSDIGHQPHTSVVDEKMDFVYTIGRGGWFVKVNLTDFSVDGFIRVGTDSRGTGISIDGKHVVISNYVPSNFVIVNTDEMIVEKVYGIPTSYNSTGYPEPSRVAAIADAPRNLMVVALKDAGEVWVLNMSMPGFPVIAQFYDAGDLLHDAFFTEDGRFYMLASQKSNWVWVLDMETLQFVGKIVTGIKPHPGPGAVWNEWAFSPSIGEGKLNIWNTSKFLTHNYGDNMTLDSSVNIGGPGLFVRSYVRDMENYTNIWWDTVLGSNSTAWREIHVLDASSIAGNITNGTPLNYTTIDWIEGNSDSYRTLHPEFTYNGSYVLISVWEENGRIAVLDANTFEVVQYIDGLTTPTGIFNIGLRALHEWGL